MGNDLFDKDLDKVAPDAGLDDFGTFLLGEGGEADTTPAPATTDPSSGEEDPLSALFNETGEDGGKKEDEPGADGDGQPATAEPDKKPEEDDAELQEILSTLFGADDTAQGLTDDLGSLITASGDQKLIGAFKTFQDAMAEKDTAIANLKSKIDSDTDSMLIQDAELAKTKKVVDVVTSDDSLKQLVGYTSQLAEKPELKDKVVAAIEKLYEKHTGEKISDLKDQAKNFAKSRLTNPNSSGVTPNISIKGDNKSVEDEFGAALGV